MGKVPRFYGEYRKGGRVTFFTGWTLAMVGWLRLDPAVTGLDVAESGKGRA